jgi:hypothetical protein
MLFVTVKEGADVYVPKDRILFAEPGPGRLTTVLTIIPLVPGPPQQLEVQGTVREHAAFLSEG